MTVSGMTAIQIKLSAEQIGVRADVSTLNAKGTRHRVKLYPSTYVCPDEAHTASGARRRGERGDYRYQRLSAGYGHQLERRCFAVCWHGFRDFFRACFEREPAATFRTSVDVWRGSEDFEARYRDSGHRNIGPLISPIAMAEACRCPEAGMAA
jgi:hypothetical protein